jgi:hypothetical protein
MLRRAIVELDVDLDQKEFEEWLVFLLGKVAHCSDYNAKVIHIEEKNHEDPCPA